MSDDEMLYCLIAFILGWIIARMMGEGFSVGAEKYCNEYSPSPCTTKKECLQFLKDISDGERKNLAPGGVMQDYYCYKKGNKWIGTSAQAETRWRNYHNRCKFICNNDDCHLEGENCSM